MMKALRQIREHEIGSSRRNQRDATRQAIRAHRRWNRAGG